MMGPTCPNYGDNDTETVLGWAADNVGNAAALEVLLRAGADVNAENDTGGTALLWAVWSKEHGDPEMVGVLLEAGAEIDHRDKFGNSALSLANQNEHTEAIRLLEAAGAKL